MSEGHQPKSDKPLDPSTVQPPPGGTGIQRATHPELWEATHNLRYLRRPVQIGEEGQYAGHVFNLQQMWRNTNTGSEEWRDITLVDYLTGETLPVSSMFFGQSY